MKFLCDQCKAKYQISDDKVAGKTVRMKCRKCGHMIEVRAAVTETSVSTSTPSDAPPGAGSSAARAPSPPGKPSTVPGKSPLATSLSQAKPPAPRPPTQRPGALNDAFKAQVHSEEAALLELASADEWYAAINGVPVGPIRIGELRRKAAIGAVTEDSLVWQEGMEEWRPVKTVPDLAAMVREAATSGRMVTPEPAPAVKSIPPAPLVPSMRPGTAKPQPPRPPPARSNVVPITSRLATAEKLEEAPAAREEKKAAGSGAPPASERFSVAPDPFAAAPAAALMPAAVAAAASLGPPAPSVAQPIVIQQKGPPNYIGIGLILMMMTFAAVAGWAFFFKPAPAPAPQPTVQTVYIPVPGAPAAPTPTAAPSDSVAAAPTTSKPAARATPKASAPAAATAAPLDLGNLVGSPPPLTMPTGPQIGGGGPTAGGGLNESQIESTVNRYKLGVRRTCWERGSSGVNNAQISVNVKIAATGHVTSAIATGNDPVTGKCLENEIQRWQFPGGPGEVNIPFKFVRQ